MVQIKWNLYTSSENVTEDEILEYLARIIGDMYFEEKGFKKNDPGLTFSG